ncbi:MAG: hypothetical protein IPK46_13530 [Saprospiraceae bacterium]|nr:hypothetical protein [Saprospiraceae bacterium]
MIEKRAKEKGYKVIKTLPAWNWTQVARSPGEIANFKDALNNGRFKENMVVAAETFITSHSNLCRYHQRRMDHGWQ